jgi:hypothetical protein
MHVEPNKVTPDMLNAAMSILDIGMQERLAQMDEEDMEDIDEDYILTSRLEAGLFTLQQSALILGNLWFHNDVHLRKRILLLLHQQVRRLLLCHHRQPTQHESFASSAHAGTLHHIYADCCLLGNGQLKLLGNGLSKKAWHSAFEGEGCTALKGFYGTTGVEGGKESPRRQPVLGHERCPGTCQSCLSCRTPYH